MTKGQKFVVTTPVKIQGKQFAAGTLFEVYMASTCDKENHLIVACAKNGKMKSISNPRNFAGISPAQVEYNLNSGVIVLFDTAK